MHCVISIASETVSGLYLLQKPETMKTKQNNLIIGVFLLCVLCCFSGCKKTYTEPAPVSKDPPSFVMDGYSYGSGGAEYMRFFFKNVSEAVKLQTLTVTAPDLQKWEYTGDGTIMEKGVTIELPDDFPKTLGFWSFTFTGKRTSDNSGFTTKSKYQVTQL
jgi:hypothetical protein